MPANEPNLHRHIEELIRIGKELQRTGKPAKELIAHPHAEKICDGIGQIESRLIEMDRKEAMAKQHIRELLEASNIQSEGPIDLRLRNLRATVDNIQEIVRAQKRIDEISKQRKYYIALLTKLFTEAPITYAVLLRKRKGEYNVHPDVRTAATIAANIRR